MATAMWHQIPLLHLLTKEAHVTPEQQCELHGLLDAATLIRELKRRLKMPNHHDWERADFLSSEIALLRKQLQAAQDELASVRGDCEKMLYESGHRLGVAHRERDAAIAGNAKVIRALDAALQWGEALFAFLPEGMVLSEGVKTAKGALDAALRDIRR